jgi:hypothetical protein
MPLVSWSLTAGDRDRVEIAEQVEDDGLPIRETSTEARSPRRCRS